MSAKRGTVKRVSLWMVAAIPLSLAAQGELLEGTALRFFFVALTLLFLNPANIQKL